MLNEQLNFIPSNGYFVKNIREMNSPQRIYNEWIYLYDSKPFDIPDSKYLISFDKHFDMVYNLTKSVDFLFNDDTLKSSEVNEVSLKLCREVYQVIRDFSNIEDNQGVMFHINNSDKEVIKRIFQEHNRICADALTILSQYMLYIELLSHPNLVEKNHWDIINKIGKFLQKSLIAYLNSIRSLVKYIPYEHLVADKELESVN